MWNKLSRKQGARKSRSRKGKNKKNRVPLVRLLVAFSLLGFLFFTIGAVGYVIFFRTVLA